MRTLQFDVRTQVTRSVAQCKRSRACPNSNSRCREAVLRVMEAAGLKQADKKRKVKRVLEVY